MKTLPSYLLRQVIASLVITVVVFTFVLLLANVLKEISGLFGKVQAGLMAEAFGLLIPYVWVFALPMGMLTASLLVFGRFSADQELTAARAGGMSLLWLSRPVLLLSLVLCGVSALVNLEFGPRCREAYTSLRARLTAELSKAAIPEGFLKDVPGYTVYIGKNHRGNLDDVIIYQLEHGTNCVAHYHAARGRIGTMNENLIELYLYDWTMDTTKGETKSAGEILVQLDLKPTQKERARFQKIDDMTFRQLRGQLQAMEDPAWVPVSFKRGVTDQAGQSKDELDRLKRGQITRARFLMNKQVAFSFACFGFTLVGIPLGVRVHRRETNVGFAIALALVAIYYAFLMLGQSFDTRPELAPWVFVWAPNFLFQGVGAFLLWRANRG